MTDESWAHPDADPIADVRAAMQRAERERDQANELTDKIAAELRLVTRERDALARRCAVRFEENQALRQCAEIEDIGRVWGAP